MYFSVCFLVQVNIVIIEIDVWDAFFLIIFKSYFLKEYI